MKTDVMKPNIATSDSCTRIPGSSGCGAAPSEIASESEPTHVGCDNPGGQCANPGAEDFRTVEGIRCDTCGRFGAVKVGDRALCPDCYAGSGSCCPEFGKDDLWTFPKDEPVESNPPGGPTTRPARNR